MPAAVERGREVQISRKRAATRRVPLHRVGDALRTAAWSGEVRRRQPASVSAAPMRSRAIALVRQLIERAARQRHVGHETSRRSRSHRPKNCGAVRSAIPRRHPETARRPEARSRRCAPSRRSDALVGEHSSTQPPAMAWPLTDGDHGLGKKTHRVVKPCSAGQKAADISTRLARLSTLTPAENMRLPSAPRPWHRCPATSRTPPRSRRRTRCRRGWPCRRPSSSPQRRALVSSIMSFSRGGRAGSDRWRIIMARAGRNPRAARAWITATVSARIPGQLMQQRERQRHLMQQRDDADACLTVTRLEAPARHSHSAVRRERTTSTA